MKIRSIEVLGLAHALPTGKAYGSARALQQRRSSTLVRLRTEDGVEGIGEAQAPFPLVRAQIDLWRAAFVGTHLTDRELVFSGLLNRSYHMGLAGPLIAAYSGINIAMLDALGKTLGLPACRLIGGLARSEVQAYATGVYITEQPARDLAPQLETIVRLGFPAAKIKIGLGSGSDAARTAAARKALGEEALLMVDANGNYTVDMALESMRSVAAHRIHWYEEPLPPHDYAGYAELRSRAPMPLSAGEAHYMAHDFQRLLQGRCIDVAQPTVASCGGLDEARRVAELCRLHNVRVVPAAWGSAVGLAAALHFAASLPPYPHTSAAPVSQMVEYDVGENPLRDELLAEPLRPRKGVLAVPQGPGLGVTLDESALKRFASSD
jgi:D-galactarolactone cycloisomerase